MKTINSLAPLIDQKSTVLILGSIPGVESLRLNEYYANRRNHFWQIVYSVFDQDFRADFSYEKKINFILSKGIALWDVIEHCQRTGSLDSNIKEEKPNNIQHLLLTYPNIRSILFNGTKAYQTFDKHIGFKYLNIFYKKMPSTSPAYTISLDAKLNEWIILRDLST